MNIKVNDTIFNQFPVLESERLRFRAFEIADAAALFAVRSNDDVMRYMDTDYHLSETDSLQMIQNIHDSFINKVGVNWVIANKETNAFIGYIGFWRFIREHVRAEIGYALHPDFWGKGYMTETARTILNFGFQDIGLHSIEANVNIHNQNSIVLLKKVGFVKEAHFRENYFYKGKFIDSIIYSMLETDFTNDH